MTCCVWRCRLLLVCAGFAAYFGCVLAPACSPPAASVCWLCRLLVVCAGRCGWVGAAVMAAAFWMGFTVILFLAFGLFGAR